MLTKQDILKLKEGDIIYEVGGYAWILAYKVISVEPTVNVFRRGLLTVNYENLDGVFKGQKDSIVTEDFNPSLFSDGGEATRHYLENKQLRKDYLKQDDNLLNYLYSVAKNNLCHSELKIVQEIMQERRNNNEPR